MTELTVIETGEIVEEMTRVEAERITSRIADKLDSIADNLTQVLPLIGEALTRNAWKALGYASPTAYVSERFAGALERLPIEVRRPVVAQLSAAGMSTRAIAPVVGVSVGQVHADRTVGVQSLNTSPAKDEQTYPAERGETITQPSKTTLQESKTITGMDGKTYTRPEPVEPPKPRAEAITRQFTSAISDLNRVLDKLHRISNDNNFTPNKNQVATLHGNDLARAISELQDLADALN